MKMKIRDFEIPPKKKEEKNFNFVEKEILELSKFDTDGYDEYNSLGFQTMIKKKNIKPETSLDLYLEELINDKKDTDFSLKEIAFHSAMRAWLHCDYNNAIAFIKNKFNFNIKNKDNLDFAKKYKFLNLISILTFENLYVDEKSIKFSNSKIIQEELSVFDKLRDSLKKDDNSILFNYLINDYISVIEKKKSSVKKEIDFKPFEIAPKIFALDKMSAFVLVSNHFLKENTLYTSNPEDYEEILLIIKEVGESSFLNQDKFNKIIKYFSPINLPKEHITNLDFQIYRKLNEPYHRNKLSDITGINIKELSVNEQFYFLNYLKFANNSDLNKIKDFNSKFNLSGFKTFISIEHGGSEMGDKILELGEKLPKDVANKVFRKYSQIIDNVGEITNFMKSSFKKEIKTKPGLINKIEETLYKKGKDLLSKIHNEIIQEKEVDFEDINKQLDRINIDTITTFAIFKQAVKNGEELPIGSIEGSVFSKKNAVEIPKEKQKEMLELYDINWKDHPDKDFVESLKSYFKTSFIPEENKSKNNFYTFEKDEKIRAFVRFEEKEENILYASALNVDDASKSFGLGEAMMDEALKREAQDNILYATCRKDNPSNMKYFEKGFISKESKITNKTEEFDLIWDENKNKDIIAKQMTHEELIKEFKEKSKKELEVHKANELNELHKTIPKGKALVRCFINSKKKEWYAVYEKISENYGVKDGEVR